ncbi:hypothetical protein SAMN05428642_10717 [Flaviramulus basaltis]|uniref:Lipocalin-like domain-containing protein n=1 Tax=Flaviramulus basaltis TaxID=369401 RepID=A0A1K2IRM9_9FLAO|nr:hypothetical protein [Flaviramulus basaltis]SFZ95093.1 hypothetical protein SAMN05428642_10717 [Flaviramulus basaltis]
MKYYTLILLISFITFTNCSINNNDNDTTPIVIITYWSLDNVSGGVAGIDEDFSENTVKWIFNETTSTLNVENNNDNDTKPDGLDSGNYNYSVLQKGSNLFLIVGSNEIGRFTVSQNQLVINENETSNGTLADGYIYTFKKIVVTE